MTKYGDKVIQVGGVANEKSFDDVFIVDYVMLLEYDGDNMFYSMLYIDYIHNDIKNLLRVDIDIKRGQSYYSEKFKHCIKTFKVENNKAKRIGVSVYSRR